MKKRKFRKKVSKILRNIIVIFAFILIFLAIYIKNSFGDVSFEQLLYSLTTSTGTSLSAVLEGFVFVFGCSLIGYLIFKVIV